jgi:inhibitor of Bruton tyrosine kinase
MYMTMTRSRNQRALSSGSYQEAHLSVVEHASCTATSTATQLLQSLLHLEASGCKSFLHTAFKDLHLAKCLLERCRALDELNHGQRWQERFLLQANKESGYTPLHAAIVAGDFPSILLYLQYPTDHPHQYVTSPIALLQARQTEVCKAVDAEGLTPIELLGTLQSSRLRKCRENLGRHVLPVNQLGGNPRRQEQRSSSFDLPTDEDEDISHLMHLNRHFLGETLEPGEGQKKPDSSDDGFSYGFEVVTFGRPHHCALGVISGNKEGTSAHDHHPAAPTFRPQRVQEFSQERVLRDGSAVSVAASTYHTLVACRNGHLYVFGLNKGGRLGLGDDCPQQCPLPRRVMSLKRKRVVGIAAAENHSLCVTSDGIVWSWGNNQFGQLGDIGNSSGSTTASSRSVPRPVEDLKHVPCSAVAAGERHSVALSQRGEVYVWGNNNAGQMGVARRSGNQKVQRVGGLWSDGPSQQQNKVALAISAAEQSTLVLTAPVPGLLPVNSVYWFGHGNHVPMKVQFDANSSSDHPPLNFSAYSGLARLQRLVNPVAIACAKYHNAAITSDGRVYTWGTSSESLGRSGSGGASPSHRVTTSPQLVSGMLPENGGGFAVALSASEQHTAVVTDTGALFTWGVARGKNAMGHEGVRWQPSPKRVPGVHRAVSVAVAKEHTVLLIGTIFPTIPAAQGLESLELLSARVVVEYIDLFNVLPILIMAEHTYVRDFRVDWATECALLLHLHLHDYLPT